MVSTISLLNEDFGHHVCDHQLQRQSDEFYTSTWRQGDCTQHKPESQHLEWEDCDLAYIHIGGGTMGAQGAQAPTCFPMGFEKNL